MALKSKIKWVALVGLALSVVSLVTHFLLARFFATDDSQVSTHEIQAIMGWSTPVEDPNYGKIWSRVQPLQNLHSYSTPRKGFSAPTENNNGFLLAHIEGDFHEIRSSICDLVVVARHLNVTLVLPELQEVVSAKGISSKYKGFGYIYDEKHFIMALMRDVLVVKNLPKKFMGAKKLKTYMKSSPSSTLEFYLKTFLPVLKSKGVLGLVISGGGCLQSMLPLRLAEYQRLRCRVAFEALRFRKEVQELGFHMVQRLQALGQPYLAYHPGLERDSLAFHGCAERFQDLHTQLIQYKRAAMIQNDIVKGNLTIDSELQWKNGSCPIMPEEVGVLLRALGYGPHTRIYISGGEIFGGQRVLIPLRAMFNNLEDRTTLTTEEERAVIYGPEEALPPPPPPSPSAADVKKMLAAWEVAGPRPRPLPPPPSRNMYMHELEGWWSWLAVSDQEPPPSLADLRLQGHKLLWEALDYIVCVESTAFFPGFDRDRNGRPNFASLVMGHRAYLSSTLRTYRPDRKSVAKFLEVAGDKIYHPSPSWIVALRKNLRATLDFSTQQKSLLASKAGLFLSHPVPECSCRLSTRTGLVNESLAAKQYSKDQALADEEACPRWMENDSILQISVDADEDDNVEAMVPEEMQQAGLGLKAEEPLSAEVDKTEKEGGQSDTEEEVDAND